MFNCNLPARISYDDCIEFSATRRNLCNDVLYNIDIIEFEGWMTPEYETDMKPLLHADGVVANDTRLSKKVVTLVFRVYARSKLDHQQAIQEVKKVMQVPKNESNRLDGGFRELKFCLVTFDCVTKLPKTEYYCAGAKLLTFRPLDLGKNPCRTDFVATFLIGNKECSNAGCFYSCERQYPDRNQTAVFQSERICGDPVLCAIYGFFPDRVENILGDWNEFVNTNGNDPFFFDRFFQQLVPICYDGLSCTPLSFSIDIVGQGPVPGFTIYVFCADGNGTAFHVDDALFQTGDRIFLNSDTGELTWQSQASGQLEDLYPFVDVQWSEFPCLCPMKLSDQDISSNSAPLLDSNGTPGSRNYAVGIDAIDTALDFRITWRNAIC